MIRKMQNIIGSITFVKSNILNEKILSPQEMNQIVENIAKENITFLTKLDALSFADASVAMNQEQIMLLIKTPKLNQKMFTKIHVYPVLHDNHQIHLQDVKFTKKKCIQLNRWNNTYTP